VVRKATLTIACLSLLLTGSVYAGTLTRGLPITGGENAFAQVALQRFDNGEENGLIRLRLNIAEAKNLSGYGFTVQFDQARYEFVEAKQVVDGLLSGTVGESALFIASNKTPGEVVVGLMNIAGQSSDGTGDLVEMVFRTQDSPLPADFQVLEGVLVDLAKNVDQVTNVHIDNLDLRPTEYGLNQNMPNPFNPATTINYQIPDAGRVKIVLYNVLGQEVRTLVDQSMEAGFHNVVWDGADEYGRRAASGLYVYRMTANNFNHIRKMMLLK
jgi:hypothetical protein